MSKLAALALVIVGLVSVNALATVIDLTTDGSSGVLNGALFVQYSSTIPTGTGNFDSFLRIGGTGVEKGYNTDGPLQWDTKAGLWTHSLPLSSIPTMQIAGTVYREFALDANQTGTSSLLSLDELVIHVEGSSVLTNYPTGFSPPVYEMGSGNGVVLDNNLASSGSGRADILVLVPSGLLGNDETKFVYLYTSFGSRHVSNDGYEEWGVSTAEPFLPEPATLAMLALGGLVVLLRRRRRFCG